MTESADTSSAAPAAPSNTLPAGIVTFVLTDIEGSTRVFRQLGEGFLEVLATHNELLRAAVAAHGGVEVGTEGDSLLVAFTDSAEALAACIEGLRALAAQRWPDGVEIRVRIGVHTGEATPVGDDYVALPVHQVARISAGAHGGQILVSEATAKDAEGRLPPGASLAALGSFQLRGFQAPERLYQLRHPDLRDDFPPLRAVGVLAHNLPFLRASFVGRAEERTALAQVLRTTGIVTVVGPGGVGKTRLAVQVAFDVLDDFDDGAWLVELASLIDPASVPRAVASAMGITEVPGRSIDQALVEALGPKSALLILDNCEHLLDAVAGFADLLSQRCPHLVILSTSREPLDIEGEVVWRVEPLPVITVEQATGLAEVAASDAARLFTERAALVRPGFQLNDDNAADVARIVSHLSGIPLAIELAAAALVERSLSGVLSGLTDRFSLLVRGRRTAPTRHQTLRAALEWSLDLLEPSERRLFDRLSVFAGGGTIEAATEVCRGGPVEDSEVPNLLRHLVRASLLSIDPAFPNRWTMLESIRDLGALELAEAGETDDIFLRHRRWAAQWVEAVEDLIGRSGQAAIMTELAEDGDNIRRAIESAVSARDSEIALRICAAMSPYWTSHGDWTEGSEYLRSALALSGAAGALRGRALSALGGLLLLRGELEDAKGCFEDARQAAMAADDDLTMARALAGIGHIAFRHSELVEAQALWEEALARAESAGDQRVAANVLRSLAIAAGALGRQDRAGELLDRAIGLAETSEDDQLLRLLLGSSAEMNLWLGRYQVAEAAYGDALELATKIGDISARPLLLAELGWVALLRGDPVTAQRLSTEAVELAEDLGTPRVLAHAIRLEGEALIHLGDPSAAAISLDRALGIAESLNADAEVAGVFCSQAYLSLELQELGEARRHAEEAIELSALPHTMRRITPQWVLGMVALMEGDTDNAREQFVVGLAQAEKIDIPRYQAACLMGLAGVDAAEGRTLEARAGYWQALELSRDMGDRLRLVDCMIGLAASAAGGEPQTAAQLVGAAGSLRGLLGAKETPREAAQVAKAAAAISDAGDPGLLTEGMDQGSKMNETEAVATARLLLSNVDAGVVRAVETR